jgi:3-oxoacyl-[acyl-carrier protein] reductase
MNKVFIITGGADGIGRACAVALDNMFPDSIFGLVDIQVDKLESSAQLLENASIVKQIVCDVANFDKVNKELSDFLDPYQRLDAIINSAGYIEPFSIEHTPMELWNRTFNVNIHAVFNLTKLAIPYLEKVQGRLVNIASTSASSPRPGWTAYAASKASLLNFSLSAAQELAPKGIKVYNISPGRCATVLRKRQAPNEDPNSIMQPETVGEFVADLMSEKGDHLHGQDLIIRRHIRL